ncbi:MAG: antibiotic biosynthesis monooxygenase [Gammaproteobacteria bacterium]|nr:antibiotic biosynthesis monooxygenase [Gammaproteobacteria bacterium]
MYAVIFKAEIDKLDDSYFAMAAALQERATTVYGCQRLISVSEGNHEITISYWTSLEQIQAWRNDVQHRLAQDRGRSHWYRRYQVEVADILTEYGYDR